ncbi:MAG TPA: hypothetical protein VMV82_02995 [Candidatus Dormibacteraeota bacterium]|nr:hypothetical protein [Candidatus Dormibacteraeota bacterium]
MQRSRFRLSLVAVAFALAVGFGSGVAFAVQTHMFNALSDLRAASNQLSMAITDKAGHRIRAMGLVNQAITEVQAGIAAGR